MDGEPLEGVPVHEQTEPERAEDNHRKKGFLITLAVIVCFLISGALVYYYKDQIMPDGQIRITESRQPLPAQPEKQDQITVSEPVPKTAPQEIQPGKQISPSTGREEQIAVTVPVPEKAPQKSREAKSIVNTRTPSEPKSSQYENVKPMVSRPQAPEQKSTPLDVSAQKTPVKIRTVPDGASIYIDGHPAGKAPATIMISRGSHRIRISSDGYRDAETRLIIEETIEFPVHIALQPNR